eukprot:SAG22_NODE_1813_length_3512_cov_103.505703_2_plen_56_part_00
MDLLSRGLARTGGLLRAGVRWRDGLGCAGWAGLAAPCCGHTTRHDGKKAHLVLQW